MNIVPKFQDPLSLSGILDESLKLAIDKLKAQAVTPAYAVKTAVHCRKKSLDLIALSQEGPSELDRADLCPPHR